MNPLDRPFPTYPKGTVVAACGCMYSPIGRQEAACRLHGQVREIQSLLRIMVNAYDRDGKLFLDPQHAMPAIRRFVQ